MFISVLIFSTAKDKGTLSFAFLKISNADGTVIADNVHSLPCYKPAAKPADSSTFYLTDTGTKNILCKL
jgi:hypothetical protein